MGSFICLHGKFFGSSGCQTEADSLGNATCISAEGDAKGPLLAAAMRLSGTTSSF